MTRVLSVRFSEEEKNRPGSSSPRSPSPPPSPEEEKDFSFDSASRKRATSCYCYCYSIDSKSSIKSSWISSTFGKLIVLKILLFDLAVSFGDAVTDILQGVYLICWYNERGEWVLKEDTWHYGLCVLIVCWVPGLVCVIHILTHYR